jgi:hypothetical protein
MIKKVVLLVSIVSVCALCASNFVIKKESNAEPKKKISLTKRREQLCQRLYDVLTDSTSVLRTMAKVQEKALVSVADFLSSSGTNVLAKADVITVDSLERCIEEYTQAQRTLIAAGNRLHAILDKK